MAGGRFILSIFAVSLLLTVCRAAVVTHYFNLTWVMANPDGLQERKVIGFNNTWPLPVIEVDKGDQLVMHVYNGLGDKDASVHFHGMFQNSTNEMDGANMITQCPIVPGGKTSCIEHSSTALLKLSSFLHL